MTKTQKNSEAPAGAEAVSAESAINKVKQTFQKMFGKFVSWVEITQAEQDPTRPGKLIFDVKILPWHRKRVIGPDGKAVKALATQSGHHYIRVQTQRALAMVCVDWAAAAHPVLEAYRRKDGTATVAFIGEKAYCYRIIQHQLGRIILDNKVKFGPGEGRAVVLDATTIFAKEGVTVEDVKKAAELTGVEVPQWVKDKPVIPSLVFDRKWF